MSESNFDLPKLPSLDEVLSKVRSSSITRQRPASRAEKLEAIASQLADLSEGERQILSALTGIEDSSRTREVVTECPIKEEEDGNGEIKILINNGYDNRVICKYWRSDRECQLTTLKECSFNRYR